MKLENIKIRKTDNKDIKHIMEVQEKAFGYKKEADLTADLLRDKTAEPFISLLAFYSEKPVGHVLFTRVYINEMNNDQPLAHILAPLAVNRSSRNRGLEVC